MSDLAKALRKRVELSKRQPAEQDAIGVAYDRGVRDESARLSPLWDKVIAVVEAADVAYQDIRMNKITNGVSSCSFNARDLFDALEQLRLAVGEK